MKFTSFLLAAVSLTALTLATSCSKKSSEVASAAKPAKHEHHPPHGGTPVVLGEEAYHVELVRDAAAGKLEAYILDGEMENFVRSSMPALEILATANGKLQTLALNAVANSATGETVGDTAFFEAQADWLKTTPNFDGRLKSISIRGSTFSDVTFNFPRGNDRD